jgi:hypothetical protein
MEEVQRQPPAEAVPVTDDGLVKKIVLQEGTGALPPKHARCLGECITSYPTPPEPGTALSPPASLLTAGCPLKHGVASPAVHFVGRLAETGEVFMNTREESESQEPETLVAGRGEHTCPLQVRIAAAKELTCMRASSPRR